MNPVVGIPACAKLVDGQVRHDTPARYAAAVFGGSGALPVMIPPLGEAQIALLDLLDGLLLPGSPSNVHPSHYDGGESETPDQHDLDRDATTLRLIPEAIARGMPVLAICRGIQELNVALGGTLHQRVHDAAGGWTIAAARARWSSVRPEHLVSVRGALAAIVGASTIMVNSLHGQAIEQPASGLVVEATAPDGTIEAVRLDRASCSVTRDGAEQPGPWVIGIQWHPEWQYANDSASVAIFRAFGDACRRYRAGFPLRREGEGGKMERPAQASAGFG